MNEQDTARWWQQPRVQYAALALLGALLVFVMVGLPSLVAPVQLPPQASVEAAGAPAARPIDSPFQDAQLARNRKQAQEILAKVLRLQDQLERQGVQHWATQAYQVALDTALKADDYYQAREFQLAQDHYLATLARLEALAEQSGEALAQQLTLGQQALADRDAAGARAAFALALQIDQDQADAQAGMVSAEALEQVLALLREGQLLEKTGHWQPALEKYQAALALDPHSAPARAARQSLAGRILERDFTQAMSDGFAALKQQRFAQARQFFAQAGKLRPGDESVPLALAQVDNQSTQASLQRRLQSAKDDESAERWQSANAGYAAILATDASVLEAVVGKLRTDARAALDSKIEGFLAKPLALANDQALAEARQTLTEAEALSPAGPKLQQQRKALRLLVEQLSIPRRITLKSDNLTQVTVYHVGQLGAFEERALELKPGTYTAVGTRPGFRDVRKEFTVALEASQVSVEIRCVEKIALDG